MKRPSGEGVHQKRGRIRTRRFEAVGDLRLTPGQAWRILGDTDHMNRVLRLPPVDFSPPGGPETGFARRARARLLGRLAIAYRENPFEWVRERSYSVLREFETGPFASLRLGVLLERPDGAPAAGGAPAVRVRTFVEIAPAGLAGSLLAPIAGRRMAAAMLDYCARSVAGNENGRTRPPARPGRIQVDEPRLEGLLEALGRAPVPERLLSKLRERITRGSDAEVLRMRPFEVADDWDEDRFLVLRLFLHGTRAGLLELRWELMCPACRVPKDEVGTLADLPARFHCDACGIDYETDFDHRVELRFSVHPAVRTARDQVYCIGGPLRASHVLLQQRLASGEERRVVAPLREDLRLRAVGGAGPVALEPGAGPGSAASLDLRYGGGTWRGATGEPAPALSFAEGEVELRLRNDTPAELLVRLEAAAWDPAAATAAQVTALQEFRDLFSSEVLAPGQEIGVSTVALLFSDLKGSTSLYEGIGDAPAYGRVHRHFDFLRAAIARHHGAVVKTIGDAVMGAFSSLGDALLAALEIQRDLGAWCAEQRIDPPFELRIGVHAGPVIAVNANERLDYFGRTVNLAARVERESVGGDVVLLEEILEEPVARPVLEAHQPVIERFHGRLRGIAEPVRLVRLRPGRSFAGPGRGTRGEASGSEAG